jgi:ADP-ribosylglycohydrolase
LCFYIVGRGTGASALHFSLGGDSDTLGSIAGAIAEALHGIPEDIQEEAESRYLAKAPDIIELMREMYRIVGN